MGVPSNNTYDKVNHRLVASKLLFVMMLSLYFGRLGIYIGFSLKPYMMVLLLCVAFFGKYMKFTKFYNYEIALLTFFMVHSLSALQFRFPEESLRFLFALVVVFVFYLIVRGLLYWCRIEDLERAISISGLIGVGASLLYYFLGLFSTGLRFSGNAVIYGLMVDRGIPRLAGTPTSDPNISAFFLTLYFVYTLCHLDSWLNRIGIALSFMAILLSFSRGAHLALVLTLVLFFLVGTSRKKYSTFILLILTLALLSYLGTSIMPGRPLEYVTRRFFSMFSDGGSGRLVIWDRAFEAFKANPIFGIGINSTKNYNLQKHGRGVYVHNSFLEILVESGLLGFSAYATFSMATLVSAVRLYKRNRDALFVMLSIISMFVQMFFLSVVYSEAFYLVLLVLYRYLEEEERKLVRR